MTAVQALSDQDREHLRSFREAARQVRESSIINGGDAVVIRGERQDSGRFKTTALLLASEPFRSLALSVRLVYQTGEPAHFGRICNIFERSGDPSMRLAVRELRAKYNRTLSDHHALAFVVGLLGPESPSPQDMFETWLYFGAFHQDPCRRADYEAFAELGDVFPGIVQSIMLRLSGRILDLDDVVADFLHELRLPRITGDSA